jgi:hypothetical protein
LALQAAAFGKRKRFRAGNDEMIEGLNVNKRKALLEGLG